MPYGARRLIADLPPPAIGLLGIVVISAGLAMWAQIYDLERHARRGSREVPGNASMGRRSWGLRRLESRRTLTRSLGLIAVGTVCLVRAIAHA